MKLFNHFIRGKSIQFKLLLYFMILILLPIVTLGVLGNYLYSRSIEDQANVHTAQMIGQVTRNVEFYIHDMENIISYLAHDSKVKHFLKLKPGMEKTALELEVSQVIGTFTNIHPEIAGILIVSENDLYISNEMYRIARDPLTSEIWYRQAVASPKTIALFSKPIGRNITAMLNYSADEVVSITKAVIDPATGQCLGVILIDLKLSIIKQVIEAVTLGKTGFLYIMDANGGIVYAPVNPIVYRVKPEWLINQSGSIVAPINSSDYQVMYKDSDYTKWKTIGIFSLSETLKEVTHIRYYSLLIVGLTLVLAVIAAFFFTETIAKPLSKLRSLMKKAEEGDMSVQFKSKYNDEIGQLGNSFNNMITEISNLIDMVYAEQKRKREAELKTLQAQIKPHFLYNTLDTIQWMAQSHNAQDIVNVVGALANLFRIGLSNGKEMITMSEELEHIKNYLVIQKARYEDKLDYDIIYDEKVLQYKVLKLILQPLVENAIYHGINSRRGGGKITIDAHIMDDKLYVSIVDNGKGITTEKLQDINEMLSGGQRERSGLGFGIYNVNERIRLSFGLEYGLKFRNIPSGGTIVEVWHPLE